MEYVFGYERFRESCIADQWAKYGIKAGMSVDLPCVGDFASDVFDRIGPRTTGVDDREGRDAKGLGICRGRDQDDSDKRRAEPGRGRGTLRCAQTSLVWMLKKRLLYRFGA